MRENRAGILACGAPLAARLAALVALSSAARALAEDSLPEPGARVDLARFARASLEGRALAVEWDEPREITEVEVHSAEAELRADALRLEWWGSVWPAHGTGGWKQLDDPWNGRWVSVEARPERIAGGRALRFRFPPLSRAEWERAPEKASAEPILHRTTLKIRVVAAEEGPEPASLRVSAFGRPTWRRGAFDVEVRLSEDGARTVRLEVRNGFLERLASLPAPRASEVEGAAFRARGPGGSSGGARVGILFAEEEGRDSNALTRVTVRFGEDPSSSGFSFVPQDVERAGALRLRDFGALVVPAGNRLTLANDPGPGPGSWERSVRERVAFHPEATYASAMAGLPRLAPARWVPLGVPSARQEIFVSPEGNWSSMTWSIGARVREIFEAGKDSRRIPFRKSPDEAGRAELVTEIDTSPEPRFDGRDREGLERSLEEGHLPWIRVRWKTGDVRYEEELGATTLAGDYADDAGRRGDEAVALLVRLAATNEGPRAAPANVSLRYSHDEEVRILDDGVVAIIPSRGGMVPEGLRAVRGWVGSEAPPGAPTEERPGGWRLERPGGGGESPVLSWSAVLEPRETRAVYVRAPFVDLLEPGELVRLRSIEQAKEKDLVLGYWRERFARGLAISVPDRALEDFLRANLWHIAITTDRDPVTGLYNHGVATIQYHVFANETVMVARSLDLRGEHAEAERCLEPMLRFQGREPLKGRFSTREGAFHSAGPYTHGEYAMNHGFVLWGVAEHFLLARDRAYLERVAPQLIRGCDFLAEERKSTMGPPGGPRSPIHGLAPASSLEDVVEFQHWFATNAYFHLGMAKVAEALAAAGHPEAARIGREAEAYRQDIERAAREAAARAAAVPLRNGFFVPYVPSRVGQWRHLTEGWIREALYPALHLATGRVVPPEDPLITWMLDDLEDTIFFSWQSGLNVSDFETSWFEKGGITLQPCLLDSPSIYLARDEIPAALRAFWNAYAASIYPDAACFAEWIPRLGQGGGPVYKTSDEARFVIWLRELLLWEDGDELWLARGAPRAWLEAGKSFEISRAPTRFGKAGFRIESGEGARSIRATVDLPARDPPRRVWLRLRHPEGKRPRRVSILAGEAPAERILGEDILLAEEGRPAGRLEVVATYE